MLSIGDSKVSKLYLGDTEIKKAYLGDTIVFDGSAPAVSSVLDDVSWDTISAITARGEAQKYWKVGDTKTIILNGTVGTLALENLSIGAVILGFDHNQELESPGEHRIHWGIGKIGGTQVALCDSVCGTAHSGIKCFNLYHWNTSPSYNYGGWKGCDLRYDILGSTNVPPSGYGSAITKARTGYDPVDYDIVNSPVPSSLMSALPIDLRQVMKTATKYTDNIAGGSGSVRGNVSSSIEYLSLLSAYETFTLTSYANSYEKDFQSQYAYFQNENEKKMSNYKDISTGIVTYLRSPYYQTNQNFNIINKSGKYSHWGTNISMGLFSVFFT